MSGSHRPQTVIWVGPKESSKSITWNVSSPQLIVHLSARDALITAMESPPSAILISADWMGASVAIQDFMRADLAVPIIAVTKRPVPLSLMKAISAGASEIVGAQASEGLAERVTEIIAARRDRDMENALLRRLSGMTKGFLKTLISLEQRNLQLSEALAGARGEDDPHPSSVLVIDDEPGICRLFDVLLSDKFTVTMVGSGEDGLAVLSEHIFPVVLLDKNLPGMSGLEVLRRIKQDHPASSVIMITGYSSEQAAIEALNAGASAYLQKPFDDVHAVQKTVMDVFNASRQNAQNMRHLGIIKQRNHEFLTNYQRVEAELDQLLAKRDLPPLGSDEAGG